MSDALITGSNGSRNFEKGRKHAVERESVCECRWEKTQGTQKLKAFRKICAKFG